MSDANLYAKLLCKKFSYTNTFFHIEPRLDIANLDVKWFNFADFVITSDVFEHVKPPIPRAFQNLYSMLK